MLYFWFPLGRRRADYCFLFSPLCGTCGILSLFSIECQDQWHGLRGPISAVGDRGPPRRLLIERVAFVTLRGHDSALFGLAEEEGEVHLLGESHCGRDLVDNEVGEVGGW